MSPYLFDFELRLVTFKVVLEVKEVILAFTNFDFLGISSPSTSSNLIPIEISQHNDLLTSVQALRNQN